MPDPVRQSAVAIIDGAALGPEQSPDVDVERVVRTLPQRLVHLELGLGVYSHGPGRVDCVTDALETEADVAWGVVCVENLELVDE